MRGQSNFRDEALRMAQGHPEKTLTPDN